MATGEVTTVRPISAVEQSPGKGTPRWNFTAIVKVENEDVEQVLETFREDCRDKVAEVFAAGGTVELYIYPKKQPSWPPLVELPRQKNKPGGGFGGGARGTSAEQINAESRRVALQEARAVVLATLPRDGMTPQTATDLVLAAAERFAAFIGRVAPPPIGAPATNQPTSSPAPKGAAGGPVGKPSPKGTDGAAKGAAGDPGPAGNGQADSNQTGSGENGRLTPDNVQKLLKKGSAKGLDEQAILKLGREMKIARASLAECTVEEGRQLYEAIKAALPAGAGQ